MATAAIPDTSPAPPKPPPFKKPPARTKPPETTKKKFNWRLLWGRVKYWGWNVATKSLVTVVYLALISQGLRYVLPDLGMKLSRLPGLAFLDGYEATYRIDLAHVFTAVPLFSAWILWHLNLELFLRPEALVRRFPRMNLDRTKRVIVTMGAIIITGDALLFMAAFTLSGWGEARFSATALLATAVYVTVLGFVTFVAICLAESIHHIKLEEEHKDVT